MAYVMRRSKTRFGWWLESAYPFSFAFSVSTGGLTAVRVFGDIPGFGIDDRLDE
jgi:hypothetical protein